MARQSQELMFDDHIELRRLWLFVCTLSYECRQAFITKRLAILWRA